MTQDAGPAAGPMGLADGCRRLRLDPLSLWVDYFAVGGNGSLSDVRRWLSGDVVMVPDPDHDLLAQALNDRFTASGLDHPVSYRD
jgi:hypothetical protein